METLKYMETVLPLSEFNKLKEMSGELTNAWNKRQIFRTETEARFCVLNSYKFPTKASKYWQSIREQTVHFNELVILSFELRRNKIKLNKIEEKLKESTGHEKDLLEIDRDELLFSISSLNQIAKNRIREIEQWSLIKKELNDGSFDDENVNTHQKESLFKLVINKSQSMPENLSCEDKLSIEGLLHDLSKELNAKKIASEAI